LRVDEDGNLWWRKRLGRRSNLFRPVGSLHYQGYLNTAIDKTQYSNHSLAWCLYYGEWPPFEYDVDHINGDRADNRKTNLRLATRSQNAHNTRKVRSTNTSGYPGVYYCAAKRKWGAYITKNYNRIHGGFYDLKEDAITARLKLELEYEDKGEVTEPWYNIPEELTL
jgi:hypothetical protein